MQIKKIYFYLFCFILLLITTAAYYPRDTGWLFLFFLFIALIIIIPGYFLFSFFIEDCFNLEESLVISFSLGFLSICIGYVIFNYSIYFENFRIFYILISISAYIYLAAFKVKTIKKIISEKIELKSAFIAFLVFLAINAIFYFEFMEDFRVYPDGLRFLSGSHGTAAIGFVNEWLRPAPHMNPSFANHKLFFYHYAPFIFNAAAVKISGLPRFSVWQFCLLLSMNIYIISIYTAAKKIFRNGVLSFIAIFFVLFAQQCNILNLFGIYPQQHPLFSEARVFEIIFINSIVLLLYSFDRSKNKLLLFMAAILFLFTFQIKANSAFINLLAGTFIYLLFLQNFVKKYFLVFIILTIYLIQINTGFLNFIFIKTVFYPEIFCIKKYYLIYEDKYFFGIENAAIKKILSALIFLVSNFSVALFGVLTLIKKYNGYNSEIFPMQIIICLITASVINANFLGTFNSNSVLEIYIIAYYFLLFFSLLFLKEIYLKLNRVMFRMMFIILITTFAFGNSISLKAKTTYDYPLKKSDLTDSKTFIKKDFYKLLEFIDKKTKNTEIILQPYISRDAKFDREKANVGYFSGIGNKRTYLDMQNFNFVIRSVNGVMPYIDAARDFYDGKLNAEEARYFLEVNKINLIAFDNKIILNSNEEKYLKLLYSNPNWTLLRYIKR